MEYPHRLYLSKGKQIVYIDNCKLPQHQIDGIRFLYRQHKKKKLGVIMNDPPGYNKEVQIVLFLKAMCHFLDKAVLVLCPEGTEHDWKEMFLAWTDLGDDVAIETSSPKQILKKKVIINPMTYLPLFSQQQWSVLVVCDENPSSSLLRYSFKAGFKIWCTSVDMKDNLSAFSSIYNWINQEKFKTKNASEKFNIKDFAPDSTSVKDMVDKAILLDTFMEDVVLRRKMINYNTEANQGFPTLNKVSRKNKDATGTKIKRSKRKIEDTTPKDTESNEATGQKVPKSSDIDENLKATVHKTDSTESIREPNKEFDISTMSSQDMQLLYKEDSVTQNDDIYEMDTQVDHSSQEAPKESDNDLMETADSNVKINELKQVLTSNEEKWTVTQIVIQETDDASDDAQMKFKEEIEKSDELTEHSEVANEITGNKLIDNGMKSDLNDKSNNELPTRDCSIVVKEVKIIDETEASDVNVNEIIKDPTAFTAEILKSESENKIDTDIDNDNIIQNPTISNVNEVGMKSPEHSNLVNVKSDKELDLSNSHLPSVTAEVNEVKCDEKEVGKSDIDDIDIKNNEYRELVMKRFKGSVLDSIF